MSMSSDILDEDENGVPQSEEVSEGFMTRCIFWFAVPAILTLIGLGRCIYLDGFIPWIMGILQLTALCIGAVLFIFLIGSFIAKPKPDRFKTMLLTAAIIGFALGLILSSIGGWMNILGVGD